MRVRSISLAGDAFMDAFKFDIPAVKVFFKRALKRAEEKKKKSMQILKHAFAAFMMLKHVNFEERKSLIK